MDGICSIHYRIAGKDAYLVEMGANPSLPVLAEVYCNMSVEVMAKLRSIDMRWMLTVVDNLLVVLDRLN